MDMNTPRYGLANQTLGSVAGIGSATAIPTDSPSGIRDAISFTEGAVADLHSVISHLESRLDTALTPIPPQPATSAQNAPSGPPVSNVRGRISLMNGALTEAIQRLHSLRDRIEI